MAHYFSHRTPARGWVGDTDALPAAVAGNIPSVCDHEATYTGLLDVDGDPIMRAPRPIGFGRDEDW